MRETSREDLIQSILRVNIPSRAKARSYFAAFTAVRVKTSTYQSCRKKKQKRKFNETKNNS
jgi:hypothetical protein